MSTIVDRLSAQAAEHEAAGRIDAALSAITRKLAIEPRDADGWEKKGDLLFRMARPTAAFRAYQKATEVDPRRYWSRIRAALVSKDLRILEVSLRIWLNLGETHPEFSQSRFEAGRLYGRMGQLDVADRLLSQVSSDDAHWLGEIAAFKKARREAASDLLQRLRHRQGDGAGDESRAVFDCALALAALGRTSAVEALLEADRMTPTGQATIRYHLERRRTSQKQALSEFQGQLQGGDFDAQALHLLADGHYQVGDFDAAAQMLDRLGDEPLPEHIHQLFFLVPFAQEEHEASLLAARRMAERLPFDTVAHQYVLASLLASSAIVPLNAPPPAAEWGFRIPPMLLQFWDKPTVPDDVGAVMRTWDDPSGVLDRVLFDDAAARRFIGENYSPAHLTAYDYAHHPAMKSDFFRLCYLNLKGGIYLDVDEACTTSPAQFLQNFEGFDLVLPLSETAPAYTNNNMIGCVAGHPVIASALDEALRVILQNKQDQARPDIWDVTGPGALTRSLVTHLLQALDTGRSEPIRSLGLLAAPYLSGLTALKNSLSYKGTAEGNWRLIKEGVSSASTLAGSA